MSSAAQRMTKLEKSMPINNLFDAFKLRSFVSKHPRHTIHRLIRPEDAYEGSVS